MSNRFTQTANSEGAIDLEKLEGFSDQVARKILSSDADVAAAAPDSQLCQDLAYMVRELLLARTAAEPGQFERSANSR